MPSHTNQPQLAAGPGLRSPLRSLPRIQLPADAVAQLGACTRLRFLEAELNFTVRDDALLTWRALSAMRTLRLGANFYLTEAAVAAVLAAMPDLRVRLWQRRRPGQGPCLPQAEGLERTP